MGRPEDPTRPDPIDRTRTPAHESAEPTETRGYDHSAPPETTELPAIPGYDLLGELGRGGIGVVYKALHVALNRTVAVKLVVGTASVGTLIRFRQEAEAVAKLQHPNIVQVFEVGACAAGSFLVLEYIDGGTLKDKVAGVPQPPRDAARMVETLARAVHHAHDRRLIHRDLKPSNVLMTSGGVPKIADFGLARSLDAGGGVTVTTDFVGTPAYAAPEQINTQVGAVGPATDVYALGVVLYELITGRLPFEADAIPQVLRMVAEAEPVPPHRLKRDCPRDLETICLKCLQKDPRKRYAGAADLADDLRRFVAGEPITARPVGKLERVMRWCRRNPVEAALIGLVFTLLTTVAVGATVAALRIDSARRDADENARKAGDAAEHEAEAKRAAEQDRDAARKAEHEGKEKLFQSLVSEAKASRFSRRIGQRFGTLAAIQKANLLARELGKPPATFDELRNLAIAALALPDLQADTAWSSVPTVFDNAWGHATPDPAYRRTAVAHQRGTVSIRRIGTGPNDSGEIARIPGLGSEVRVQWSSDGRHLAVIHWLAPFQRLQVWRTEDTHPALVLDVPKNCHGFVFAPDGRTLIAFEKIDAQSLVGRRYDVATGQALGSVPLPADTAHLAAVHHPHRSELAISQAGRVVLIDLNTGKETGSLTGVARGGLSWHPGGELLAVAYAQNVDVWDMTRRVRTCRVEHTGDGLGVSFNTTGDVMMTVGWTFRLRLWNPYTGQKLFETTGHGLFGSGDHMDVPFPQPTPTPVGPLTVLEAGREYRTLPVGNGLPAVHGLASCSVHPGGRLVAVSMTQGVSLIDLATGSERAFLRVTNSRDVLFEPDGSLLIKSGQGILHRWPVAIDPADPHRMRVGPPEVVPATSLGESVASSIDGSILAASNSNDGAVIWHRDRPYEALHVAQTDCRHVAVSGDGKFVAGGSWHGRGIKVWETATGRLVQTLLPEASGTIPFFSPDGKWLMNWRGQRWRVSDWSEGPKSLSGVAMGRFSPDSRLLAWAAKGFVILTETETGRELARLEDPHQDGLNGFTFSPDGTLLLGATNDSFCVRVWDLRKIRAGLRALDLDWAAPAYSPAPPESRSPPLSLTVVGEAILFNPVQMRQAQQDRALQALWVNPWDVDARLSLADVLISRGRVPEAEAQLSFALALRPEQTAGYRMRSLLRYNQGKWEQCIADATAVLARAPVDALEHWHRGYSLTRLGRHADAILDLTAALEHYTKGAGVYLVRAEAYRELGRMPEAVADWKKAAEFALPTNTPTDLNSIAWRLLTGPPAVRDDKRALELATLATNVRPNDVSFLNTLGLARYRNGLTRQAIISLDASLRGSRGAVDAHSLFVLAMCHAKMRDSTAASRSFQRAVGTVGERANVPPELLAEIDAVRAEAETTLHTVGIATEPAPPPRAKRLPLPLLDVLLRLRFADDLQ